MTNLANSFDLIHFPSRKANLSFRNVWFLSSTVLASNMIDPLKGGWGYLIVMCAILVAVINQGLQLSTSLMAAIADRSFHVKGPQFGVYSGGKTDFHPLFMFEM